MEIIAALGAFFKTCAAALGLIHDKKVEEAGVNKQLVANQQATIRGAEDARRIEGRNAAADDADLAERMRLQREDVARRQ